jgi:anti-sigma28 factor (negative regulator of flagellin synthesis)
MLNGKSCASARFSHMKIHNDGLQGTNPLETGRTTGTPQTGGTSGLPSGHTIAGHEGDSVQISGISQHLAESNALDTQQRENRVAQLASQYAKGNYQVNAAALSHKLVSNSLGSGGSSGSGGNGQGGHK